MKLRLTPEEPRASSGVMIAACLVVATGACSDSQVAMFDGSTSGARAEDAALEEDASEDVSPDDPDGELEDPSDAASAPGEAEVDAGPEDDAGALDAGEEIDAAPGAGELDAAMEGDSNTPADASVGDASVGDAALEAAVPDQDATPEVDADLADASGCAASQPADLCGVCGGDGASCAHPLSGRYAARTQFFAHQHGSAGGEALDVISKGNLLSVVDIDAAGGATEHYCYLELESPDGIFVWSPAATLQRIADTTVPLEVRAGRHVRPLSAHRAYFGWSPQSAPADCVAGQTHATGCACAAPDALPASEEDCRLVDIEEDGHAGGSMFLGFARPDDPDVTDGQLELKIAALLSLEWDLEAGGEGQLVGAIAGGMQQSVLGVGGPLAGSLGAIDNAMCDASFGHVELVRGEYDCAALLSGRSTDPTSFGIFDTSLDPAAPASVEACQAPPGS